MRGCLFALALLLPLAAFAETIRFATFNASLTRNGAGLLLRAIEKGEDPQIRAVIEIIQHVRPDVLLINEFDHDVEALAATAFRRALAAGEKSIDYPHSHHATPNTGYLSGFDLNGDGKTRGPDDAFGYGSFPGQYGMLLLSRFPIDAAAIRDFGVVLWADLPDAKLPLNPDGTRFPSEAAAAAMRFSSKSHWDVPVRLPTGVIHVFASHPTPPVFDGPEDRNGLRNAAEISFWSDYIDGTFPPGSAPFVGDFVILGDLNADPMDGDGRHEAIAGLLTHPRVQDPEPRSDGAEAAGQSGRNATHLGDPSLDTADWNDTRGPGNLRVDYVLPSEGLTVAGAGVFWPDKDAPLFRLIGSGKPVSSDHRLVWVDLKF